MSSIIKHDHLPEPSELKKCLDILVAFDIIMEEDSRLRRYNKALDPEGQINIYCVFHAGDSMFIIFSEEGCIIKGFDHESCFSPHARKDGFYVWPGIYDEAPQSLLCLFDKPMFRDDEKEDVTFCIWREALDSEWRKGSFDSPKDSDTDPGWRTENFDDDGFQYLMLFLKPSAEKLIDWAKDYYDDFYQAYFREKLPLEAIKKIYAGEQIDEKIINEINPKRDARLALKEITNPVKRKGRDDACRLRMMVNISGKCGDQRPVGTAKDCLKFAKAKRVLNERSRNGCINC